MLDLVWLIPALPLAGFLSSLVFGRRLGEPLAGLARDRGMRRRRFVARRRAPSSSCSARPADERDGRRRRSSTGSRSAGSSVDVAFLVDPLSITMALFVTGIGALIHLYSIGYMHGDPKFSKFFIYLNLFVFSMLMLVLGDNLSSPSSAGRASASAPTS